MKLLEKNSSLISVKHSKNFFIQGAFGVIKQVFNTPQSILNLFGRKGIKLVRMSMGDATSINPPKPTPIPPVFFEKKELHELTPEQNEVNFKHAIMSQHPYKKIPDENLKQYDLEIVKLTEKENENPIKKVFMKILNNLNNIDDTNDYLYGTKFYPETGLITHPSGIAVYLFIDNKDKKITLSFGGTNTGKCVGTRRVRSIGNFPENIKQHWLQNAEQAFLNKITPNLIASRLLFSYLLDNFEKECAIKSEFKNYSFSGTGHSRGGLQGCFAVMMNTTPEKPIKGHFFCSAQANDKVKIAILNRLNELQVPIPEFIIKNITCTNTKGDKIPRINEELGFISQNITNLSTMGTVIEIDNSSQKYQNQRDTHAKFFSIIGHKLLQDQLINQDTDIMEGIKTKMNTTA